MAYVKRRAEPRSPDVAAQMEHGAETATTGRLAAIRSTACRKCGAARGEVCKLANGSGRISVHRVRWDDYERLA
jgi:hypothetical protein